MPSPGLRYAEGRIADGAGPTTLGMDLVFCIGALKHWALANDVSTDPQLRAARSAKHQLAKRGRVSKSRKRDRRPTDDEKTDATQAQADGDSQPQPSDRHRTSYESWPSGLV